MSDFNSSFSVQIISTANTIRSRNLESKLSEFGLRFQISPGVVPKELDFHDGLLHSAFLSKLILQRDLRIGEVGCALAHRNALNNFLNSDHKFGLIFEDDAEVIAEFNLESIQRILNSTCPTLIVFGWNPGFAIADNVTVAFNEEPIELITPPLCTFAYAVNRPAAKLMTSSHEKIIDVADWPIHVLNKMTFYATASPWVYANPDEEFSTIGVRSHPVPTSTMGLLVSRVRLVSSVVTLLLLSKTNWLNVSPKQIVHRLIIQPILYEYGLNQVNNDLSTNDVKLLPPKFQKFGLVPSRWTHV
jgi:GR25 family glycosyltransferase involved in LPS biosynthesis